MKTTTAGAASVFALVATAVIMATALCTAPASPSFDINAVRTFRDIPGITNEETAAIEALRKTREKFSYGQMLETEAFILPDGTRAGFAVRFCELLTGLFGVPFVLDIHDWESLKRGIDTKQIDFTGDLTMTAERVKRYFMTYSIAERTQRIYVRADNQSIRAERDADGLKMGYWEGSIKADRIRNSYPDLDIDFIGVNSFDEAANMLMTGEIAAFVSEGVIDPMFERYPSVRSMEFFPLVYTSVSMTTADPELSPIISAVNKYIAAGGIDVLHELYRAGGYDYARYRLNKLLTDEEKAYISDLASGGRAVKIGLDDGHYPVCFYNRHEGRFMGMAVDVIDEIVKLVGIPFEIAAVQNTTSAKLLEALRSGEVSMISELPRSPEREGHFLWADRPYAAAQHALLSKYDYPDLAPYQIVRAKVGVIDSVAYVERFSDNGNLVRYGTRKEALLALEAGEIDLLLATEHLLFEQQNFHEKPGYKINILFPEQEHSYFGFNKDEEILRSIVSKAQEFVNIGAISRNWAGRRHDYIKKMTQQRLQLVISVSLVLAAMLAFMTYLLLKNRKISRNLDLTVKKRTRELELQTGAAEAASRSKSVFLANMSHEIRTPMNSIIGFTELALAGDIKPKTREYLSKISESADLLLDIINDILDISKIEAGRMELEIFPFDLRDVFTYCRAVILPKAEAKGLALDFRVEPSIDRMLVGDSVRLRQALLNMLSNAVKFTDTGKVELIALVREIGDDGATINFEVRDSGIGMSPEQAARVFEPFTQADNSITRKYGGTGLGLTITKNLIEIMGGKLTVESAPGIGSNLSFELKFGVADRGARQGGDFHEIEKPLFDGEVLICEDNVMNQQVLREHLDSVGLKSVLAENGREAVEIVEKRKNGGEKPFDLILMDIHMPVMDGLEATEKINALGTGTPVVAITASLITSDWNFYRAHGMADFLGKPFKAQDLWGCLMKFCRVSAMTRVDREQYLSDEEKILRHLKINFVKSNQRVYDNIVEAVDRGDIVSAHRLAHTLKGNAGQIGELRLQAAVTVVEDALTDGRNRLKETDLAMLNGELTFVHNKLKPMLTMAGANVRHDTLDTEKTSELFVLLGSMLANCNPECMNLLGDIRAIPGSDELVGFVENFDFKQAAAALAELKEKTEGAK